MTTILVVILLGATAVVLAMLHHSWSAPAPLLAGYWALAIALPSLAGYPGTSRAAITIAILVIASGIGAVLAGGWRPSREPAPARVVASAGMWHRKGLAVLMTAGGLTAAAAAYMTIRTAGFHLSSVLSAGGLFQVGSSVSVQRYTGPPLQTSALVSLLFMVTFMGALAAPRWLLSGEHGRLSAVMAAFPIVGATMYGAVSTARAPMVISWVLWAGSYLTCRAFLGRPVRLRTATIARVTIGVAVGVVLFVGIAFIRIGGPAAPGSQRVAGKVEAYAFGYLPAFSAWLSSQEVPASYLASQDMAWGDLTFNGLTKFADSNPIYKQPYAEYVTVDQNGNTTNVYTIFRGLIEDFGITDAAIVMLVAGFIGARFYEAMRDRRSLGSLLTTTMITSVFLFSTSCSLFFFTNICAAFLADAIAMRSIMTVCKSSVPVTHINISGRQRA